MIRQLTVLTLVSIVGVAGCGGGSGFKVVPVSGTVTLDGEPLANATVTFLPQATGAPDAGPASVGETDASGKFTLKTGGGEIGAVVASHQVMITTVKDAGAGAEDDNVYAEAEPERVPARYNSATTLSFDVPDAGTAEANFSLMSAGG